MADDGPRRRAVRRMNYLDYQATTPLAPEAFEAMLPWLRDQHANPHSAHRPGRAAKAAVEVARAQVAALLPPGGRVVFTSGATEALNWAIKGTTGPIVTTAVEHAAVLDTVAAEERRGRGVTILPVRGDGSLRHPGLVPGSTGPQASQPEEARHGGCRDKPGMTNGLWSAMLVNNEIGTIQPVAELADRAHAAGALFLCDAVQGYGRVPIPANVDLVAISAHKVHGPKGIGALWIRDGVRLDPLLHGGDQEGGRSGTLSPALCVGFGVAARLMQERADPDRAHVERLWAIATDRFHLPLPAMEGSGVGIGAPAPIAVEVHRSPGTRPGSQPTPGPFLEGRGDWTLNGSATHRYPGNLNIRRPGLDVARLMSDCRDIAFSAGSACASGSGRPSHVLKALGLSDAEARASIRLGWGRYTTEAELTTALDRIAAAAEAQRIAA
jgi:cysteine desulfurase